jgi:hypothetical protein
MSTITVMAALTKIFKEIAAPHVDPAKKNAKPVNGSIAQDPNHKKKSVTAETMIAMAR